MQISSSVSATFLRRVSFLFTVALVVLVPPLLTLQCSNTKYLPLLSKASISTVIDHYLLPQQKAERKYDHNKSRGGEGGGKDNTTLPSFPLVRPK